MKPRINVYKMLARASWEWRPRVAAVSVRRWDDAVVTRDRRRERRWSLSSALSSRSRGAKTSKRPVI